MTASKAVEVDTVVKFKLVADSTAANAGTTKANLNDFNAGSFNEVSVTILKGQTTATTSISAITNDGTELSETYSMTATIGTTVLTTSATILDGSVGAGQNFVLTKELDVIPGMNGSNGNAVTSGNDTVIGVMNTTAGSLDSTLTAVDQINTGDGTDTLKITVVGDAAATIPTSAENVEVMNVASSITDQTVALTVNTTTMTGLQKLNVTKLGGDLNLDAAAATAIDVTAAAVVGAQLDIDGGTTVGVTLTNAATAADTVTNGAVAPTPTGAITVSSTGKDIVGGAGAIGMNAITTTGGTTVNITQNANSVSGNAATAAIGTDVVTQGAVTVTGGNTTTVTTQIRFTHFAALV